MENRADIKRKKADEEKYDLHAGDVVGSFVIQSKLGKGKAGGAVYTATRKGDSDLKEVALKFPSNNEELEAVREINGKAPNCLGVARLIAWGYHTTGKAAEKPFVVIDLLRAPITDFFEKLKSRPLQDRWQAMSILGRMLVRTLEALHRCGIVHCDVQPSNICSGSAGITCLAKGLGLVECVRPFLVDFGCARLYPGGKPMRADWGSVDFNSISAAAHGTRTPWDDLESLGWVLLHGLWGELPWFEISRDSVSWHGKGYWELHRNWRCGQIGRVKEALLSSAGAGSFDEEWKHLLETPPKLFEYLRVCHRRQGLTQANPKGSTKRDVADKPLPLPDYEALAALLGSSPNIDQTEADRQDLQLYFRYVENCDRPTPELKLLEPVMQETRGQLAPPATVLRWLEEHSCFLLDCRSASVYKSCTLPGAINIALGDASWRDLAVKEELVNVMKTTQPLVCFGDNSSTDCDAICRSLSVGRELPDGTEVQADRLFQLEGGMEAWVASQFPTCEPQSQDWKNAFKRQRQLDHVQGAYEVQPQEINGLDGQRGLAGYAALGCHVYVRPNLKLEGMNDIVLSQCDAYIVGFDSAAERYMVQAVCSWSSWKLLIKAEDLMLRKPTGTLWEIVGGADRGGIIVRAQEDFLSEKLEERLSYGAIVLQKKQSGKRLHYRLSVGEGPKAGWISISLEDKILARKLI